MMNGYGMDLIAGNSSHNGEVHNAPNNSEISGGDGSSLQQSSSRSSKIKISNKAGNKNNNNVGIKIHENKKNNNSDKMIADFEFIPT